jgi:hypothetical protein
MILREFQRARGVNTSAARLVKRMNGVEGPGCSALLCRYARAPRACRKLQKSHFWAADPAPAKIGARLINHVGDAMATGITERRTTFHGSSGMGRRVALGAAVMAACCALSQGVVASPQAAISSPAIGPAETKPTAVPQVTIDAQRQALEPRIPLRHHHHRDTRLVRLAPAVAR